MSEKIIVNSIICPNRRTSFSFSLFHSLFLFSFLSSFSQTCRLRFAADIEFRDLLVREWTPEFSRNVKRVLPSSYEFLHCLFLFPFDPSLFSLSLSLSLPLTHSSLPPLSLSFYLVSFPDPRGCSAAFTFVFLSSFRFSCLSFSVSPHSRVAQHRFPADKSVMAITRNGNSRDRDLRVLCDHRGSNTHREFTVPFKHAV